MTSLTKLQRCLAETMKHCEISDAETYATILTGLETEQQQWMMLDYLDYRYDQKGEYPKEPEVIWILGEILRDFPTPEE